MTEEQLQQMAALIVANREEDPEFEHPDMDAVQTLVTAAITRIRYARFGIDTDKNLVLADRYLSLARGDATAIEEEEDNG